MLDNQAEEAVKQIGVGKVDIEIIRKKHLDELRQDPVYVADQFVKRVSRNRWGGTRLRKLLYMSIGRIAVKECRRDIHWCNLQSNDRVSHIADWLAGAIAAEAAWLSNVDEQGRPKKLMKFGSLDAMHDEADKQMRKKLPQKRSKLGGCDEENFADEGGEYYLVQMKTSKALENESGAMCHCVGHGAYERRLSEKRSLMLSLRDRKGWPHMTIEIANGEVVQARGKANSYPKDVHAAAAHRLLDIWGYYGRASGHLLRFIEGPVRYEWN
jgi:hypothetical protein